MVSLSRAWLEKRCKTFQISIFVLSLLLAVMLSSAFSASQPNIKFQHLTINQGLSQNSVLCMLQDSQGFMWFGTWDGLNRYDGYHFTIYKNDPSDPYSLSSNAVWTLYEDRAGTLWAGTQQGGGLNKYDRAMNRWIHYQHDPDNPQSLSHNDILTIYQDQQDILWIGTADGLDRFDRATEQFTHYRSDPEDPRSLSHNTIYVIYEDRTGVLWIGTKNGLNTFDYHTEQFTRFQPDPSDPTSLSYHEVFTIHEDHHGNLWIGTSKGGMNRFNRDTQQFTRYQSNPNEPHSLGHNQIRAILEDQAGNLWIGTYGGGLDLFDREREQFLHYRHNPENSQSLGGNMISTLYEDRTGILWVGTEGEGVSRYDHKKEKFKQHYYADPKNPNSLSNNYVRSIYQDRSGILWVGTYGGGLNRLDHATGEWKQYQASREPGSLADDVVLAIYEDRHGFLWIGTQRGLQLFDRKIEKFSVPLVHNFIRIISEDRAGKIWIGTYGGGLSQFDQNTGQFVHYREKEGDPHSLSQDLVTSVYEDRSGVLWVGTLDYGLNRFDRDTKQFGRYQHEPSNPRSLSHNRVTCIHEDQAGAFWIGTAGGLNKFDRASATFTTYTQKDGLPNDVIYGILEDQHGNLWMSTNKGLSKFTPSTNLFRNYDINDGLQSNEFGGGAYYKNQEGEMFFGGINGFNAFYPDEIQDNPYPPLTVLTDFQIFNKSVTPDEKVKDKVVLNQVITQIEALTLSWQHYVFSFEFAALDFTMPERNQYAYFMEGFDEDWNYVGTRRFVTYTNLPGGKYLFRVRGSNNDGVWNEEGCAVAMTVTPPPWKTWWAYTLYVFAIIGVVLSYIQYKQIQYKRERAIIDRFVPYEYLKFLDKTSILDVQLGDHISKDMAVMFSDIRGFTTLSETMTPKENFDFVNAYLRRVSPVIRDNEGFIVKFLGDGMMAVFPNGAQDGVNAAIEKLTKVKEYNEHRKQEGRKPIKIGIGVHTGHMMVGMIGEKARMQGDAFSDNVNLTSRLEGLTKYYGVSCLISGETLKALPHPEQYHLRFLEHVMVIGKEFPIQVYELFDADPADLFEKKQGILPDFEEAQQFYFNRQFEAALPLFKKVLAIIPDDAITQCYVEYCKTFMRKGVPEDWDGVRKMDKK